MGFWWWLAFGVFVLVVLLFVGIAMMDSTDYDDISAQRYSQRAAVLQVYGQPGYGASYYQSGLRRPYPDDQHMHERILAHRARKAAMDKQMVEQIQRAKEEADMKKCHACGQKLPLKAGDKVEFYHTGTGALFQGIVTAVTASWASVTSLHDGRSVTQPIHKMTRLRGYYRITEREPLS